MLNMVFWSESPGQGVNFKKKDGRKITLMGRWRSLEAHQTVDLVVAGSNRCKSTSCGPKVPSGPFTINTKNE